MLQYKKGMILSQSPIRTFHAQHRTVLYSVAGETIPTYNDPKEQQKMQQPRTRRFQRGLMVTVVA